MTKLLTLTKIEGKLALRSMDGILFGIGMPVAILFLVALVAGQTPAGVGYTYLDSSFSSLLAVGICATAFMGIPLTLCDYRDKKILKHYFVTPASPKLIMLVQVLIAMLTALVSAVLIILCSLIFLDYQFQGSWGLLVGTYFLVMLSMYSVGLLIASLCPTLKVANLVCTFVYFPMLYLSGALIPFELFPSSLQKIANLLPLTHGVVLLKNATLKETIGNPFFSMIYLIVLGIVGLIIASKIFRWE